jgi:hypothetical protein
MKKTILYRISSKGYPKLKITSVSKLDCLNNLFRTFENWNFICVADNCDDELLNTLRKYTFNKLYVTNLGNPGSFWKLYEEGLNSSNREDLFYFVEDDYLHLPQSPVAIEEGLEIFDYVTLYDHPDKYRFFQKNLNPYTKKNRFSETTEVTYSKNFIWRTTNSTTMSFAVTGQTLQNDFDIWKVTRDLKKDHDFDNFCALTKQKFILKSRMIKQLPKKLRFIMKPRRYLGLCIPGLALHLEKTYMKPDDYTRFKIPQ